MTSGTSSAGERCEDAFQKAIDRQAYPELVSALRFFESVRPQCAKDPLYLSRLSSFYLEIGRKVDAEAAIAEGLILHPSNRELLFGKGTMELGEGNIQAANTIAEKLISTSKSWYGGYYLMQRVLMDSRRFSESLQFGRRAIELSKGRLPIIYLNAAVANYHAGRLEDCVKDVETAIQKDPSALSKPWGVNEAIYALDRLNRRAEALILAKRRKNADPNWRSDPALVKALTVMGVI